MNVAAQSELRLARIRTAQWAPALAAACALLIVAATAEIVLDGAVGHSILIPKSPQIAGWLQGIGERLGYRVFLIAVLAFSAGYGGLALLARGVSKRWAIALIVLLHAIVFAGPILLSTDVFSYIAYARMGVEHGLNPYTHGPIAIAHDPVYHYVGQDWKKVFTAYGPVYTLLSYPFALLGVTGALWGMKLLALVSSAGTLLLVWRCARLREIDPVKAILLVGANPLYVIYALGGAHNDLIMLALMMLAVSLTFAGREASGAAIVVAGALVKATMAALLPFMILARRSRAQVLAALGTLALGLAIAYAVFGIDGVNIVAALNRDAAFVSSDSFATEIAHLFGKPGVFPIDHDLLKAMLVVIVLHLLWRTWRGYDWVAASGWALLAISVTSTWLLAWYILWPLPLAVIARDRRLLIATLALQGLFVVHQLTPLFAPVA
ncbi:MAG TPA: polyprenol phosphomannose-dependent alpha 1,6 mannosyltransferase MptB [Solirubrobacteraceae bacterium]|nr:polyprenol phosphomannose-dependent alpha 1,6 mannosyltransferase MptB [Solirubrobacteraceae bacterium]